MPLVGGLNFPYNGCLRLESLPDGTVVAYFATRSGGVWLVYVAVVSRAYTARADVRFAE